MEDKAKKLGAIVSEYANGVGEKSAIELMAEFGVLLGLSPEQAMVEMERAEADYWLRQNGHRGAILSAMALRFPWLGKPGMEPPPNALGQLVQWHQELKIPGVWF